MLLKHDSGLLSSLLLAKDLCEGCLNEGGNGRLKPVGDFVVVAVVDDEVVVLPL